jgi:hypothetical protein
MKTLLICLAVVTGVLGALAYLLYSPKLMLYIHSKSLNRKRQRYNQHERTFSR